MKRRSRRKRRNNGAGTAVLGFLAGGLLPPLGLGSVFAGYRPGTFWAGATWGAGISLAVTAIALLARPKTVVLTTGAPGAVLVNTSPTAPIRV